MIRRNAARPFGDDDDGGGDGDWATWPVAVLECLFCSGLICSGQATLGGVLFQV